MVEIGKDASEAFIARWQGVTASELSTAQSFAADLCRLLGVDTPHPTSEQDYMFERPISFTHGDGASSAGRIDLYKRGCFVLEAKKLKAPTHTKGFDDALLRARSQAEGYARALPASEGRPPFLIVVDVGNRIELYAEFSRSGATYTPFPDPRSHRIALADLADARIRERLRRIWTEPLSLDPARESARVTREIAARLAALARSLEKAGHPPEVVAQFLMRCLFTMFAEDVKLLPKACFQHLLGQYLEKPEVAMRMLAQLWKDMDAGGFSPAIAADVLRFNGKLFKAPDTLPLDREQLSLLLEAARADWQHVEPAIFGTLLERALDPAERHKLGAHYTPRAYVERLVLPTVIDPLRAEWSDAHAAALTLAAENKVDEAVLELRRFHHRLCTVRVLDPACGSGNFLYVTLEHLKRLEGEVLNALDEIGFRQTGLAFGTDRADAMGGETVDPHQLLGIELNPRAAAIAEVVLWIGYLQWHYRTRGDVNPPQPVIRDFSNIENRDAVLAYDRMEYVTDERGAVVTRWDGKSMKKSPVTGEDVPDDSVRVPVERYVNPRKAIWPEAEFVVGNPPFIGNKRMRSALDAGYVDALRSVWPDVPESADFVMYWWNYAAELTRLGALLRFGLITTNSICQVFNRRVVDGHLAGTALRTEESVQNAAPLTLAFAVPDHPWVDTVDGAAVRISMTVGSTGSTLGTLRLVGEETLAEDGEIAVELSSQTGKIHSNLRIGIDLGDVDPLTGNRALASRGVTLVGQGFLLDSGELAAWPENQRSHALVRPFLSGRDITQTPRQLKVIDAFGLSLDELVESCPAAFQRLVDRVKPERDQNNRESYRQRWWVFAEPRAVFRPAIRGLSRFIATPRTSKHRIFVFVPGDGVIESEVVGIAHENAALLAQLSSEVHQVWSLARGGTLEDRPRYQATQCFEPFPFASRTEAFESILRALGEQLDFHRKRQQSTHPDLTLTGMYNVLEKLRSGEPLTAKERVIHEQGLVSVLRQLHDEIDAAVLEAYGWSDLLPLLRVAHGNDKALPGPLSVGAPEGAIAAQEGATEDMVGREGAIAPPGAPTGGGEDRGGVIAPSGAPTGGGEGRGGGMTREEAKRAFDEAILERLVALNAERAAEEARGLVRWLRPEFQNPTAQAAPKQDDMVGVGTAPEDDDEAATAPVAAPFKPAPWPKETVAQVRAVADTLAAHPAPMSLDEIAARFTARGPWKKRLPQLLDMLVALGRARESEGRYGS